jgi:uncharacterized repeat protein (TIGR03803 family)
MKETLMTDPVQHSTSFLNSLPRAASFALVLVCGLITIATQPAQAQTFSVLHTFTGGQDGWNPGAGFTMDSSGDLYGTTYVGRGGVGCGTAYQLQHKGSDWVLNPLYLFHGPDGCHPSARVVFGPDGVLYGTTYFGGLDGQGTAFNLRYPPSVCTTALCPWQARVMYTFGANAHLPGNGDAVFDAAGNIYNTTTEGGDGPQCFGGGCDSLYQCFGVGCGAVYELTPSGSGWAEKVVHSFNRAGGDGADPVAGVIIDHAGNLYGTTLSGGNLNCHAPDGCGVIYQLTPSGSGWVENILYTFQDGSDGANPNGGLILDQSGNLYGTTNQGGTGQGGTVFELSPTQEGWTFQLLYSLSGLGGPNAPLTMDAAGNLYGTTGRDGTYGWGNVFKLTSSNFGWTYTSLHDFTGGSDGLDPFSNVIFDANGNLYGTASQGGAYGGGVAWEITP